jgi:hypothetical protein
MHEMKEVSAVEHREEVKREPKSAKAPKAEAKLKRFRIVKLEERIAPRAAVPQTNRNCNVCTEPETTCI